MSELVILFLGSQRYIVYSIYKRLAWTFFNPQYTLKNWKRDKFKTTYSQDEVISWEKKENCFCLLKNYSFELNILVTNKKKNTKNNNFWLALFISSLILPKMVRFGVLGEIWSFGWDLKVPSPFSPCGVSDFPPTLPPLRVCRDSLVYQRESPSSKHNWVVTSVTETHTTASPKIMQFLNRWRWWPGLGNSGIIQQQQQQLWSGFPLQFSFTVFSKWPFEILPLLIIPVPLLLLQVLSILPLLQFSLFFLSTRFLLFYEISQQPNGTQIDVITGMSMYIYMHEGMTG